MSAQVDCPWCDEANTVNGNAKTVISGFILMFTLALNGT